MLHREFEQKLEQMDELAHQCSDYLLSDNSIPATFNSEMAFQFGGISMCLHKIAVVNEAFGEYTDQLNNKINEVNKEKKG